MDYYKLFQSRAFKGVLYGIAAFLILMFVLRIGMFLGFRKANFSYRWGENYHNNFAGPRGGFFKDFAGHDFIEANGIIGRVIKLDRESFVVSGRDNAEKVILVNRETTIVRFKDKIKTSDLKINEEVVIIGEPNRAGQIEAKLVRVLPAFPPGPPIR